jgi:predicted secreted protein
MKYQVYAALIATTTAGPYADKINDLMPTEAETTQMEAKTEKWINDTQTIVDEATPSVEARNERIDRAFRAHGQQYREIKRNGTMSIQRTKREWGTEVSDAQREFETTV